MNVLSEYELQELKQEAANLVQKLERLQPQTNLFHNKYYNKNLDRLREIEKIAQNHVQELKKPNRHHLTIIRN